VTAGRSSRGPPTTWGKLHPRLRDHLQRPGERAPASLPDVVGAVDEDHRRAHHGHGDDAGLVMPPRVPPSRSWSYRSPGAMTGGGSGRRRGVPADRGGGGRGAPADRPAGGRTPRREVRPLGAAGCAPSGDRRRPRPRRRPGHRHPPGRWESWTEPLDGVATRLPALLEEAQAASGRGPRGCSGIEASRSGAWMSCGRPLPRGRSSPTPLLRASGLRGGGHVSRPRPHHSVLRATAAVRWAVPGLR